LQTNATVPSVANPAVVTLTSGPALAIISVAGLATPPVPSGSLASPDVTLPSSTTDPVVVTVAGANIPPGTAVTVTVAGQTGGATSATAPLTGSLASSSVSVSVTVPANRPSVLLATATFTLTAAAGGAPQLGYITVAGREVAAAAR
jgi:hypothetical protein